MPLQWVLFNLTGTLVDPTVLAQPLGGSDSHLLSSLAEANALIVIDEDTTEVGMDAPVRVSFLAPRT